MVYIMDMMCLSYRKQMFSLSLFYSKQDLGKLSMFPLEIGC